MNAKQKKLVLDVQTETTSAVILPSNDSDDLVKGDLSLVRGLFFIALVFSCLDAGWAMPVQFKINEMLKKAEQPKAQYPPARAGWNGPEGPQDARVNPNPTYEKLIGDSSPAAIRAQLRKTAWPHWSVALSIGMLIYTLRLLRRTPMVAIRQPRPGNLLLMPKVHNIPDTSVPAQEAA